MTTVHKAATSEVGANLEYVLSDATEDRYGDVIEPAGWDLRWFKRNPIALFGHQAAFPIGRWEDVRVEDNALKGRLVLADEGTSPRIDEIRRLAAQGVLRATSVGFRAIDVEPRAGGKGLRYKRQELMETSLVSVPANPAALQVARSMNLSDDTLSLVFGESADADGGVVRRGLPGGHADQPRQPLSGNTPMKPLAERVVDAQTDLLREKDALTAHLANDNPDPIVTDELSTRIEQRQTSLDALKRAEGVLAVRSEAPANLPAVIPATPVARRPLNIQVKNPEDKTYVYRAATVAVLSHLRRLSPVDVRKSIYGDDEATQIVTDFLVSKAAVAPATTTTSGWASQLVQTVVSDFMEDLMPDAVYPGLAARGLRLNFGRNGAISIPSRSATPTIAGSFVAEGAPIPVRQGAFSAQTLTPKKMAVISTFTREIAQHSTPAIEGLIRNAIQEDTAVAVDSVLLDATAASAVRPAGLRSNVAGTTATSGGGLAALVGDIKALVGALITATNGNLRAPLWIMNPVNALSISMLQDGGGAFPFADEIGRGVLRGYPVITSATVTAGTLMLVDAADFVSVTGDEPQFDVSDQATLHMEDTTPLAIGTAGSPNTVAAPVRSLFQTDSIGIRMILPMNWGMRRTASIAWASSVTW